MIESVKQVLADALNVGDKVNGWDANTPLLGSIAELDSMAVVTVLMQLEEQLGIEVNDDEISAETFETLGSLTAFVEGARTS